VSAVINGREVPLRTRLNNGDVVKIIRGGQPEAQPDWENMVATGKARSALRRLTRTGEADEFKRIGQMLADHAFAREDKEKLLTRSTRLWAAVISLFKTL